MREIRKSLSNFKKYCHQDDFKQKNLRDARNFYSRILFNQSTDEDTNQ